MFKWNKKYNVNTSTIDVSHKKFVDIVNMTIVAKQGVKSPEEIRGILNEMIDYAWNHFKMEEPYIQESTNPDYKQHKEEHLGFVIKTLSYINRVAGGDYQILNEIREYLKQWLVYHIQGTDKKHRECFIKN
ncbi:MAG: bacteriohemerythrin [Candidatus Scalindua sp.]